MTDVTTLVDAVIAITLCECVLLAAWRRRTGGGVALRDVGLNIVSGLFLMLALRCVAAAAGTIPLAACLVAAGLAHAADLFVRWRRGRTADRSVRRVLA